MRQPIPPGERLAVTLRFLATGEKFSSLQYQFRISVPSLSVIIPEVCQAIFQVLKDDYFKCPSSPEEWLPIAQLFHDRWQLPHCIGAADGKHVRILHPRNSGSEFYNYKGFFSVVLLAVVDADYKFIFADVGCQGRISDGGVLRNSLFWKALVNDSLGLPQPRLLPESADKSFDGSYTQNPLPFYLAGDDAFPLENNIMKPYSQRNLSDEKKDLQVQAFQSTTDQWECFWHFDKQVRGIFNCYMYKARECCQYCFLCNSSAQLFKIKSSRKVHPHWGPWHGELQWCGKWRFLEAWRCYNPICKCPKFSKGKATKEGRGNEGRVMQLPQWSRPSSMAVECLNLTFKTVSKLQILCNCDRCTKVFFWIREVFLHIFK